MANKGSLNFERDNSLRLMSQRGIIHKHNRVGDWKHERAVRDFFRAKRVERKEQHANAKR